MTAPATDPAILTTDLEAAYRSSRTARNNKVAQAMDSSAAVIWTADLDGTITMSEGGGLHHLDLRPGELVGSSIYDYEGISFDEVVARLQAGEERVRYITETRAPAGTSADTEGAWVGPWFASFTLLRSPGGRPLGVACVCVSLMGATASTSLSVCPLGACLVQQAG